MAEYGFGPGGRSQERKTQSNDGERIQYLLSAEEHLLQSISARAPLPEILNGICSALDCQIVNAVSLISLPSDDASDLATIAGNATLFGLHTLFSECIVAENDELLGSLEMYCTDARSPSAGELQLIERAKCLAAIAIKLDKEAGHQSNRGIREDESSPEPVPNGRISATSLLANKSLPGQENKKHEL